MPSLTIDISLYLPALPNLHYHLENRRSGTDRFEGPDFLHLHTVEVEIPEVSKKTLLTLLEDRLEEVERKLRTAKDPLLTKRNALLASRDQLLQEIENARR